MADARWLDREACAAYISVRVDQLPRMLKAGTLPEPSLTLGPRSPRWDRHALDAVFGGSAASGNKGGSRVAQTILEAARR